MRNESIESTRYAINSENRLPITELICRYSIALFCISRAKILCFMLCFVGTLRNWVIRHKWKQLNRLIRLQFQMETIDFEAVKLHFVHEMWDGELVVCWLAVAVQNVEEQESLFKGRYVHFIFQFPTVIVRGNSKEHVIFAIRNQKTSYDLIIYSFSSNSTPDWMKHLRLFNKISKRRWNWRALNE